jgi:putative ABC transport system permease protein
VIRHLFKLVWNRKRSNLLVMTEIFFSFLVIMAVTTAAIVFIGNARQPLGFDYRDVWVINMNVNQTSDDTWTDEQTKNFETLVTEVARTPGVLGAAGSMTPPYSFNSSNGRWTINNKVIDLAFDEVTDDYAKVMGMQVVRGRWFSREDDGASFIPVVIDENAAKAMFGNEDPVGQKYGTKVDQDRRVVGVVRSFRKNGELWPAMNFVFKRVHLGDKESRPPRQIVIRVTPGTGAAFEEPLMKRLTSLVPQYSYKVSPMTRMRERWLKTSMTPVLASVIVSIFLILMVALGLTGVMWQNVTRRTRELGLRRAVGATAPSVRRQILGEVAVLTTLGISAAVVLALHVPALGLLPRVSNSSFGLGLGASLVVIYALTLLCGLYPSWLAARVQPAEALHYD